MHPGAYVVTTTMSMMMSVLLFSSHASPGATEQIGSGMPSIVLVVDRLGTLGFISGMQTAALAVDVVEDKV